VIIFVSRFLFLFLLKPLLLYVCKAPDALPSGSGIALSNCIQICGKGASDFEVLLSCDQKPAFLAEFTSLRSELNAKTVTLQITRSKHAGASERLDDSLMYSGSHSSTPTASVSNLSAPPSPRGDSEEVVDVDALVNGAAEGVVDVDAVNDSATQRSAGGAAGGGGGGGGGNATWKYWLVSSAGLTDEQASNCESLLNTNGHALAQRSVLTEDVLRACGIKMGPMMKIVRAVQENK